LHTAHSEDARSRWIHPAGAIGAILIALAMLYSFLMASDSGETAADLIAFAEDNQDEVLTTQLIALAAPVLMGLFVASLWVRLRGASEGYRALVLLGGTLFVAFLATGLTLWSAPLFDTDALSTSSAEAYLVFDDAGWVLLGLSGISIGAMIVGASLAALELGLLPKWAGWVSVALGVLSLATVVAIGFFAWAIWLIAAGAWTLWSGKRVAAAKPVETAV
jgi:hypothetical protein